MSAKFTTKLSKAKQATKDDTYLVFGYVRNLTQNDEIPTNIPDVICYMMLIYFYIEECFMKSKEGFSNVTISEDQFTITQTENTSSNCNYYNTIFCKNWIDIMSDKLVTWKFKINEILLQGITFGLVTNKNWLNWGINTECPFLMRYQKTNIQTNDAIYSFSQRYKVYSKLDETTCRYGDIRDVYYNPNDIITIKFDVEDGCLWFSINDGTERIIYYSVDKQINIRYKLFVCLHAKETSITMTKFIKT